MRLDIAAKTMQTILPDGAEAMRIARRLSTAAIPMGIIRTAEDAYYALGHLVVEDQEAANVIPTALA